MFAHADFLHVVQESGLSKYELKTLYGVSRETIYNWIAGRLPLQSGLVARMAEVITAKLVAVIAQGVLPMPPVDRAVRARRIVAMKARFDKLSPASR